MSLICIEFCGDEVIDTRLLVDLWELPRVTKRIRIPTNTNINSVLLLEVASPHQKLTNQRLTIWHVEIGLDPHAANDLPATFLDSLLNFVVNLRILFNDPFAVLRR